MNTNLIFERMRNGDFADVQVGYHSYETYIAQKEELKNCKQIPLKEFVQTILNSKNFDVLKAELDALKQNFLYKSKTHGIFHNIRASLLAFYICENLKLSKKDIRLALLATLYHDIGRSNDDEDLCHGRVGASKLESLNLNISTEELKILKVAITCHSMPDESYSNFAKIYQPKNMERCKCIYTILKDADGLDRVRLESPYVKPSFMRNEISKHLILTAYNLERNINFDMA